MNDSNTTIQTLKQRVHELCLRKGWGEDSVQRGEDPDRLNAIAEEFADVMMYGLQLTRTLNIDITEQILRKIDIVDRRPAKPGEKKR